MTRLLLLAGLIVAAVQPAAAQRVSKIDGTRLVELCTGRNVAGCDAYVSGVADAIAELDRRKACIPPAVTGAQLREVVVKFIRSRPENRQLPAGALTVRAFAAAWRCSGTPGT